MKKGSNKKGRHHRGNDDDGDDDDVEDPTMTIEAGGGGYEGNDDTSQDNNENRCDDDDEKEKDDDTDDPLATPLEVFSFMPDLKTKIYFGLGVVCASISGMIFPALAFLFSNSFADLSGDNTGDSFLKTIRELAYSFMILG